MDTAVAEHPVHRRAGKVSGRLVGGVGGGIGVRGGDGVVIPPNDGVIVGNIVPVWVRYGVVGAVLTGPGGISSVLGRLLAAGGEGQCQQQDRQKQGSARFHVRSSFAGSLRYPWRSMPQRSGFHAKFRLYFLEKRLGGVRTYGRCSADPALCALWSRFPLWRNMMKRAYHAFSDGGSLLGILPVLLGGVPHFNSNVCEKRR